MIEQRSDEWFEARRGKFTASNISQILTKGKSKDSVGVSLHSLALDKAIEELYGVERDNFISFDMQRGIDLEPKAFSKLTEILAEDFIETTEASFVSYGYNAGASPDGLTSNNWNIEIKCPNRINFFKFVASEDIKKEYIDQMQMQMLATGTEGTYFFNYYEDANGRQFHHLTEVLRDEERIQLIKERLELAIESKNSAIEEIKHKAQY
tara:strand:+ start:1374 stop:2000 length:627 start_codon:yes stop_codon:yes gene_type:complete